MEFDPTSSYAVEGLKPDTLYKFRLGARSELGVGVYTPTIEARTAQSSKCLMLCSDEDKSKASPVSITWARSSSVPLPFGSAGMPACSLLEGVMGKVSWGFGSGLFGRGGAPKW